jgi:D-serine deaminase-like pyridoxal phosphate-dependent protein
MPITAPTIEYAFPVSSSMEALATPCVLIDEERTKNNIQRMQSLCSGHGVDLRPHIKTHKMVTVARMQLETGAAGLTCAKIGEAEALLPSGVREIFIAYSIVDPLQAPRLRALAGELDELVLGCTSLAQAPALEAVLTSVGLAVPVMMAVDTGLHREGTRNVEESCALAVRIRASDSMKLKGIYTHEGHTNRRPPEEKEAMARSVYEQLLEVRKAVGGELEIWPGCSGTAAIMAAFPGVDAVRPGTYVFGDLSQTHSVKTMAWEQVSMTVLATVVDKPEPGLALIDAGSKVFSSDKTPQGATALAADQRRITVSGYSEEHGFLTGEDVDSLRVGEKLRFIAAHVCPVMNLTDEVHVIHGESVSDRWAVEARGCVR